jgi:holo-[acyl-carrier protein] synthase
MILGIGVDIVDIERFLDWHLKPTDQLTYIFLPEEINYCLEIPLKSAERFAVRFAAKEAFYKAYCAWQKDTTLGFKEIAKWVSTRKSVQGVPDLQVNWEQLKAPLVPQSHITLSHAKTTAIAYVLLEYKL